jgi:hypothetical protein
MASSLKHVQIFRSGSFIDRLSIGVYHPWSPYILLTRPRGAFMMSNLSRRILCSPLMRGQPDSHQSKRERERGRKRERERERDEARRFVYSRFYCIEQRATGSETAPGRRTAAVVTRQAGPPLFQPAIASNPNRGGHGTNL